MNPLIKMKLDSLERTLKEIEAECVTLREQTSKVDDQLEDSKQTVWSLRKELTTTAHLRQELDREGVEKAGILGVQADLRPRLQSLLREVRTLSAFLDPHV